MNKKSWGLDVIPEKDHINTDKKYTCGGKEVVHLTMKLHNSSMREVTYPVKGSVITSRTKNGKPLITEFRIWSLDGKATVGTSDENEDLVCVDEKE